LTAHPKPRPPRRPSGLHEKGHAPARWGLGYASPAGPIRVVHGSRGNEGSTWEGKPVEIKTGPDLPDSGISGVWQAARSSSNYVGTRTSISRRASHAEGRHSDLSHSRSGFSVRVSSGSYARRCRGPVETGLGLPRARADGQGEGNPRNLG